MVQNLFVVTQGGALWEAIRFNKNPELNKLTGRQRIITGGLIGFTEKLGAVAYLNQTPAQRGPELRPECNLGWRCNTTAVVAMFLDHRPAKACSDRVSGNAFMGFKPWDLLYESDTKSVIQEIGDSHPWITFSEPVARKFLGAGKMMIAVAAGSGGSSSVDALKKVKAFTRFGNTVAECPHCNRINYGVSIGQVSCDYCPRDFLTER